MEVILWILFGLIVGVVAKYFMPGQAPGGMIETILIGIGGGLLGGWLGGVLGIHHFGGLNGFILSVVGAIILLAACGAIRKGKA